MDAKVVFVLLVAAMLVVGSDCIYYKRGGYYGRRRGYYGHGRKYFGDAAIVENMHQMLDDLISSFPQTQEDNSAIEQEDVSK